MDTRFWGPPAWRLFHTLSFDHGDPQATRRLFELLPYVLPCKFCRNSLTAIYEDAPIPADLPRWFYKVHAAVNEKLRRENGQHIPPDPPFAAVRELYKDRLPSKAAAAAAAAAPPDFPAWDFLFAVAYTHPLYLEESPIPDSPNCNGKCDREKNRWNALAPRSRLRYWRAFWKTLPAALPAPWRAAWTAAAAKEPPTLKSRRAAVGWVWRMRCAFASDQATPVNPYKEVCETLAYHASDCGGKHRSRAKTCRRFRAGVERQKQQRHATRKTKTKNG